MKNFKFYFWVFVAILILCGIHVGVPALGWYLLTPAGFWQKIITVAAIAVYESAMVGFDIMVGIGFFAALVD